MKHVGRLIDMDLPTEKALIALSRELGLPGDYLFKVALKAALEKWQGPDGKQLMINDALLYKLSDTKE